MLKYEEKKLIYWNEETTDNVKMKTKRWKQIRNYSIIVYDENAMEIGNKDTQNNVRKMKHAIITQRYKYYLHAKFGNQPHPDDININYILSLVISHTQDDINIYYILSLVISHTQQNWMSDN